MKYDESADDTSHNKKRADNNYTLYAAIAVFALMAVAMLVSCCILWWALHSSVSTPLRIWSQVRRRHGRALPATGSTAAYRPLARMSHAMMKNATKPIGSDAEQD